MRRIVTLLLLVYFASPGPFASADTVTVSGDYWFPFNGDPKSDHPGYMIEVTRKILDQHGHILDYRISPWTRSVQDMLEGKIDGIVGAARGDAPNAIFPAEIMGEVAYLFFTVAGSNWQYTGIPSLDSVILGAISDYSYGETLDSYILKSKADKKRIQLVGGETALKQNIQKLLLGRITTIVSVPQVFWTTVDDMKLERTKFRVAGEDPKRDPLYIAFSPKKSSSAHYAELLSDGIVKLRQSGELKRILDRYHLEDWQK